MSDYDLAVAIKELAMTGRLTPDTMETLDVIIDPESADKNDDDNEEKTATKATGASKTTGGSKS